MKKILLNPYVIISAIIFTGIVAYKKGWFAKKPFKLYVDHANQSGGLYVCYKDEKGYENCTLISLASNEYTAKNPIGSTGLSWTAQLNASRETISITLLSKTGSYLDVLTTKYKQS